MFNLALSRARVSIERAFGVLKGRWRILTGKICLEPSFAADIVMACSVLHNICQERNEPVHLVIDESNGDAPGHAGQDYESGSKIRQLLLNYLTEHTNNV